MAFAGPVLLKRIPDDPAKRKLINIDQYMATGGYESLRKAQAMTPEQIIQLVIDSNLRGRGGGGISLWIEMEVFTQGPASALPGG